MPREVEPKRKDQSLLEQQSHRLRWLTIFAIFMAFLSEKAVELNGKAKIDSFRRKNSFHSGFSNAENRVLLPIFSQVEPGTTVEAPTQSILNMTWLSALRIPNFQKMAEQVQSGQYTLTPEQTTAAIVQSADAVDLLLGYFERGHVEGRFSSAEYQEMVALGYKEQALEIQQKLLRANELFSVYLLSLEQGPEDLAALTELEGLITAVDLQFLDQMITTTFRYVDQQLSDAISGEEYATMTRNLMLGFVLLLCSIQLAAFASKHARQTTQWRSVSGSLATLPGKLLLRRQSLSRRLMRQGSTGIPGIENSIQRLAEANTSETTVSPTPPHSPAATLLSQDRHRQEQESKS